MDGRVSVMTSVDEPVGVAVDVGAWVRVSTAGQDEANQVTDIERYCTAHGYRIVKWYELNDRSASKGQQQSKLDEAVEDMREGTIQTIVCWHSDRLERRGPEALFKLIRQTKDAGGRIESVQEPLLGTEDISGEAATALSAVISHQESVKRAERQRISIAAAKSRGALYSTIPWGMEAVGEKGHKQIVPTDLCREVVPEIFTRCIDGHSLTQIAAWLDSEGISTRQNRDHWSESTVRWIICQRAYAGRWVARHGEIIQTCEAVVNPSTFDRAQQALKHRGKRGPASKAPAMLGKLKCATCGSPMYRSKSGNPGQKRLYYRCYGFMPQRRGCGNMVPLPETDALIRLWIIFTQVNEPYRTRQWVDGTNYDDEISEVKELLREAVDAERFDELPALQAKLAELRNLPTVPGHYEYCDTGISRAEHFTELDETGKREYLASLDIRVERGITSAIDTGRRGGPMKSEGGKPGIHLVIDGQDYGVWPYPPA